LGPALQPDPPQCPRPLGHLAEQVGCARVREKLGQVEPGPQVPHGPAEGMLVVRYLALQRRPRVAVATEVELTDRLEGRVLHWRHAELPGDLERAVGARDAL